MRPAWGDRRTTVTGAGNSQNTKEGRKEADPTASLALPGRAFTSIIGLRLVSSLSCASTSTIVLYSFRLEVSSLSAAISSSSNSSSRLSLALHGRASEVDYPPLPSSLSCRPVMCCFHSVSSCHPLYIYYSYNWYIALPLLLPICRTVWIFIAKSLNRPTNSSSYYSYSFIKIPTKTL